MGQICYSDLNDRIAIKIDIVLSYFLYLKLILY